MVGMKSQSDLPQVVRAVNAVCGPTDSLDSRNAQPGQHHDDANDYKQLNRGETAVADSPKH